MSQFRTRGKGKKAKVYPLSSTLPKLQQRRPRIRQLVKGGAIIDVPSNLAIRDVAERKFWIGNRRSKKTYSQICSLKYLGLTHRQVQNKMTVYMNAERTMAFEDHATMNKAWPTFDPSIHATIKATTKKPTQIKSGEQFYHVDGQPKNVAYRVKLVDKAVRALGGWKNVVLYVPEKEEPLKIVGWTWDNREVAFLFAPRIDV